MTNTARLIATLEHSISFGINYIDFRVGKYTGNGPSVVAALRRRGYNIQRDCHGLYRMTVDSK